MENAAEEPAVDEVIDQKALLNGPSIPYFHPFPGPCEKSRLLGRLLRGLSMDPGDRAGKLSISLSTL